MLMAASFCDVNLGSGPRKLHDFLADQNGKTRYPFLFIFAVHPMWLLNCTYEESQCVCLPSDGELFDVVYGLS